jgi:hypothetical protein
MIKDVPKGLSQPLEGFLQSVRLALTATQVTTLKEYTVSELNNLTASNYENALVRCSNGNAGADCLAYCNGRAWFVVELGDRVAIS